MTSSVQDTYDVTDMPPSIGTALSVRPTELQSVQDVQAAMALRDDDQIMQSCQGAIIKEWMYSFTIGGKEITGISVTGAAEIARVRAESGFPIRFPVVAADEVKQNNALGLRVQVTARDQRSGGESIAMVFEPYFDDKGRPNPFVERKALSKAKRNAILDLIPEQQVLQLLQAARDSASGRVGRRPTTPRREAPKYIAGETPTEMPKAAQVIGGPNPYDLASEEQMRKIATLCEHPANVDVKARVAERTLQGKYNHAQAAATCIAALERGITDYEAKQAKA